jgi:hypothetical protein
MVNPSSSGDDNAEMLIPGIPDDLAMLCLIRVARRHHRILRGVCRRWRSFASSELLVALRAKHGLAEGWVYVLSRDASEYLHWHALDPGARQWMKLPPIPSAWSRRFGMSCAVLDQRLYVIGGCSKLETTSEVHVFDALRHRWKAAASMTCARCFLASAALGGKLYAIGGTGVLPGSLASWELYDPCADRWEAREDRNIVQDVGESMVMDGKIHVRHVSAPHGLSFYASTFDPDHGKWALVDDEMTSTWHGPAAAAGKDMYMLDQAFGIKLMVLDRANGSWDRVGRISPQSIQPPCRLAIVGSTLFIVGKGLKTLVLDTEQMRKVPGLLVTTSVAGLEPLRDNIVMSCNTVYI